MGQTTVGALLPAVVTLLLGFVAARRHDFSQQQAAILNRLVLRYALPLMLFVGTVRTSRAELRQAVPLLIALCVAIVGLYAVVFLLSRFVFTMRVSTSALAALTTAIPAMPIVVMLALQYRVAKTLTAAALFFSVISSVITLAAFITLTS